MMFDQFHQFGSEFLSSNHIYAHTRTQSPTYPTYPLTRSPTYPLTRSSTNLPDSFRNGPHHSLRLHRGRAIRWHQNDYISHGARQHSAPCHLLAHSNANALGRIKRFPRPPIPDQFDTHDQPDLADIANLRMPPEFGECCL